VTVLCLGTAAGADILPYQRFHQGCKDVDFSDVEQSISEARTCAIAAEIHRICSSNDSYGVRRPFAAALEARCSKDFEGKLSAAEQKRHDKALAKCGEGLETPDGRTTHTAEAVEAKCRGEVAANRSREYWKHAPLE
jgi:hypothetical protein